MTAVPHWELVGPRDTDADLVSAALTGDRAAFAEIYDRYANRLHDFCIGMLHDRDGAADCVQDSFCLAADRLDQLRDGDKLRPWLYSIARNEALRWLRERRNETPSDTVPERASDDPAPETMAARTELATLITDAADGLSDRDRAVLELAYHHGLSGPALAEALDVSQTNANTMVGRLRTTIERSLGALLVARRVHGKPAKCYELATMLEDWDGRFTVLMRKRVSRHIEACLRCDELRHRLVSPAALLGSAPVLIPAPAELRERTLQRVRLVPSERPDTAAHPPEPDKRSRTPLVFAWLGVAVVVAVALTLAWPHQPEQPAIEPVDTTATAPTAPPAPTAQPGVLPPKPTATQSPPSTTPTTATTPSAAPPVQQPPEDEPPPARVPVDEPAAEPEPTGAEVPVAEPPRRADRPVPETRTPISVRPGIAAFPPAGSDTPAAGTTTRRRAVTPAPDDDSPRRRVSVNPPR